ncbi:5'-methylthioadenosine/adenosylhomocysteine nucleosidase [Parasphaerochaeta coccoides]|uniref:adenosylhomocysteine nucleosidase n=1 Tax=Parasphaerochaeta coccoides (strain ATCC BAA-1237 / DSM 17374 / SPN1) TaxID=760011 RepID=F4GI17_PARC1|nr:5'-methylthioadenosine/adenosylhomocysteine nucleosidase [Parasphaerochaeta coccoides]AEC02615.1 MTA/SAH nucleosidase [Parasphaerochaeta coccoides DSM 17374]
MEAVIIAAMFEEISPLRERLSPRPLMQRGVFRLEKASWETLDIMLVQCGIGKANAAAATSIALEKFSPQIILNMGSVGSLSPELEVGDISLIEEFTYHDADATVFGYALGQIPRMPATYATDITPFLNLPHEGYAVKPGVLVTGDMFSTDDRRIEAIRRNFPRATVLDMEGTAIAQTASHYGLGLISVKSVSDKAGKDADDSFRANLEKASRNCTDYVLKILETLL